MPANPSFLNGSSASGRTWSACRSSNRTWLRCRRAASCRISAYWHGEHAYSGVATAHRRDALPTNPSSAIPNSTSKLVSSTAQVGDFLFVSVYVPNGGKDFPAKIISDAVRFMGEATARRRLRVVLCGDINIARTEMDVHPAPARHRPESRGAGAVRDILGDHLVDVGRASIPQSPSFTWWAPWRNMRARNIGWRLDYVLAANLGGESRASCAAYRRRRHPRPRAGYRGVRPE